MGLFQNEKLLYGEGNHQQNEQRPTYGMREDICKDMSDKRLITKTYKDLYSTPKEQIIQ